MASLLLIATPIGNLGDISRRAIESLQAADIILAEDTRRFAALRSYLLSTNPETTITAPVWRFDEHTEQRLIPKILAQLDQNKTIALVSDAGTPLISDPGYLLVKAINQQINHTVTAIPGPSAVITALIISGLPTTPFYFIGYLSPKDTKRQQHIKHSYAIHSVAKTTFVAFETVHRIEQTIHSFDSITHQLNVTISLIILEELTKLHEKRWNLTFPLAENDHLQKITSRGELVLVWRFL